MSRRGALPAIWMVAVLLRQADPNHPSALHLIGAIAHQMGKNDIAVDFITKALALKPGYAEAHNNLGNALQHMGVLEAAVAAYRTAIG